MTCAKRLGAVAAIAAVLAVASVAQARDWHGRRYDYHRHGGGNATAAIVGGLIGLGVGAAIASSAPPPAYYGPPPGYYAPPPPAVYYGY